MTLPYVTAFTAAVLGLVQIGLMMTVGMARRRLGIPVGDGGNEALLYKVRRHGNFIENAPIFLILLGFLELSGASFVTVQAFAATFVVTRLSHAYAMSGPDTPIAARAVGAMGTLGSIVGTSGLLLWRLMQA